MSRIVAEFAKTEKFNPHEDYSPYIPMVISLGPTSFVRVVLNVRGCFKARLPLILFVSKAKEFYQTWLEQQEGEIPEESRLKFSKTWIKGWMKEYGVSLLKPNKRFSISKTDRKDRIIELLKNVWCVRHWFRS